MGAQPPRIAPPQPFRVGTRIGLVYKAAQARARLALDMFATPLHEKPEKAYQLDPRRMVLVRESGEQSVHGVYSPDTTLTELQVAP